MYELTDGLISIFGGVFSYLVATGKVASSADAQKAEQWRKRFGPIMKVICPILVIYGLFRLTTVLLQLFLNS